MINQSLGNWLKITVIGLMASALLAGTPVLARSAPPAMEGLTHYAQPKPAPQLRFNDENGEKRKLEEWKGRLVMVNLWATWCPPCIQEMPAFERLEQKYGSSGLSILPLAQDDPPMGAIEPQREVLLLIQRFYQRLKLKNLPIYTETSGSAYDAIDALGLPTTLVVNPEGKLIARIDGAIEWEDPAFTAWLESQLPGKPQLPGKSMTNKPVTNTADPTKVGQN